MKTFQVVSPTLLPDDPQLISPGTVIGAVKMGKKRQWFYSTGAPVKDGWNAGPGPSQIATSADRPDRRSASIAAFPTPAKFFLPQELGKLRDASRFFFFFFTAKTP